MQNTGSVIKPREFGKYLEAFHNSPAIPSSLASVQCKVANVERDMPSSSSSLVTREPTAPATPLLSDTTADKALSCSVTSCSSAHSKTSVNRPNQLNPALVSKPPVATKNRSRPPPTLQASQQRGEGNCHDTSINTNSANPFQPSQKVLQRTPPKTLAKPPLTQQQVSPAPLPVLEEHMAPPPVGPAVMETQSEEPEPERASATAAAVTTASGQGGLDQLQRTQTLAQTHAQPLAGVPTARRVSSGNVMHSPPPLAPVQSAPLSHQEHKNTGMTTGTATASCLVSVPECGTSSHAVASSMFRLLSNGYAPDETASSSSSLSSPSTTATAMVQEEATANQHKTHSEDKKNVLGDEEKRALMAEGQCEESRSEEASLHEGRIAAVDDNDDAVQLYVHKLSKQFALQTCPSPKSTASSTRRTAEEDASQLPCTSIPSVSSTSSVAPVAPMEIELHQTMSSTSTSTSSFFESKEVCSKGLMTSFHLDGSTEDNMPMIPADDAHVTSRLIQEELEAIKTAHFYREKELQMEVLLQRYGANSALQDLLDAKQRVREEKSLRMNSEILQYEAQRVSQETVLPVQVLPVTDMATEMTPTSLSLMHEENCSVPPVSAVHVVEQHHRSEQLMSTGNLSVDFSSIAAAEESGELCVEDVTLHVSENQDSSGYFIAYDGRECDMVEEESSAAQSRSETDNVMAHGMKFIPLPSTKSKSKSKPTASAIEQNQWGEHVERSLDFSNISSGESEEISGASEVEIDPVSKPKYAISTSNDDVNYSESLQSSQLNISMQHEEEFNDADGIDDENVTNSQVAGMTFVPLRSVKLKPTIGHVAKCKTVSTAPTKRCKSVTNGVKWTGGASSSEAEEKEKEKEKEGNAEAEDEPLSKRTCKKKSPVKPRKKSTAARQKNTSKKKKENDNAVIPSVPLPENIAAQSESTKKTAASAHVAAYFKDVPAPFQSEDTDCTVSGVVAQSHHKHTDTKKKKQKKGTKAAVSELMEETETTVTIGPQETVKAKKNKTKSANGNVVKETKSKQVTPKGSHVVMNDNCTDFTPKVAPPPPVDNTAFQKFCKFTRASVEEILLAAGTSNVAAAEVDMMLTQMWNIQTDTERAEWKQQKPKQTEPSIQTIEDQDVAVEHTSQQPSKKVKPVRKKTAKKSRVQDSSVEGAPTPEKLNVLHEQQGGPLQDVKDTSNEVAPAATEVLTPVQIPCKAVKKRQKRNDFIDVENENQDIQGNLLTKYQWGSILLPILF